MLFNYLTPGSESKLVQDLDLYSIFKLFTHLWWCPTHFTSKPLMVYWHLFRICYPTSPLQTFSNPITSPNELVIPLSLPSKLPVSHQLIPNKSAAFLTSPCRLWSHPLTCLYKIGIPLTFKVSDYSPSSLFRICCLAYFSFAGSCPTLKLYLTRFLTLYLASLCCFTTTNKIASQSQSFLCF